MLVVIAGLLVGADLWIRSRAEERIAAELQRSFDPAGSATVELGGFPFTPRLIAGSIPAVGVTSSAVTRGGVRFRDVRMTLQDVDFSVTRVLAGEVGSIEIGDGRGRAALPAAVLTRALRGLGASVDLDLSGGRLTARVGPVRGRARLTLQGTDLVVRVSGLRRDISVALPQFFDGLAYRRVRTEDDRIVIEFSLQDATFNRL